MQRFLAGARRLAFARPTIGVRNFAIQVKHVARWTSCKVASEEDAEKMDDLIIQNAMPKLKNMEGFGGLRRLFCKEKLDYKIIISFEGLENFKAYMGSSQREEILPILDEAKKYSTTGELDFQNFVLDRFTSERGTEATSALKEDDHTAY